MRRIRVIQIGLGHDHAVDILDSMTAMTEVFEVVALAVPECEKLLFQDKIKLCEEKIAVPILEVCEALALDGIEGAVIETEEKNLCRYAYMAAQKGLHIHMDKPGCAAYREFEGLVELLRAKKLVFSMGYMYRFNPEIQKAFSDIEKGNYGKIYSIEAHMNCEHSLDKKRWLSEFPGGMMFFLGCHLLDIIYRVQGAPQEVIPLNTSTDKELIGAQDFGMAVLKYENGISIVKVCDSEKGGFSRRQLVICGTEGTLEIRPIEKWLTNNIFSYNGCTERANMCSFTRKIASCGGWTGDGAFVQSEGFNRYDGLMCHFAERVAGKEDPVYTYDYELGLYKLLLAACGVPEMK